MIVLIRNAPYESIETNIGISKDYNNFELTNALAKKDILKSNRISNFFAQNPKDNPLVVSVGVIFNFFQKVLLYHTLTDKSSNNAARVLKVNPYFIKDYQAIFQIIKRSENKIFVILQIFKIRNG